MISNEYRVEENTLILKNGKVIMFDYPIYIEESLVVNNVIIILLKIPPKRNYNNNVFALNEEGGIIWQISYKKEQLFYQTDYCHFTGTLINKEGKLVLFNWGDTAFVVDYRTGKILDSYCSK